MRYMDQRFNNMVKNSNPLKMLFMMGLRFGLLIFILICGKFSCEWFVDQSHNTVISTELKSYTKTKMIQLRDLHAKGKVSATYLKKRVNEIHNNTKQNYLKDKYNDEK